MVFDPDDYAPSGPIQTLYLEAANELSKVLPLLSRTVRVVIEPEFGQQLVDDEQRLQEALLQVPEWCCFDTSLLHMMLPLIPHHTKLRSLTLVGVADTAALATAVRGHPRLTSVSLYHVSCAQLDGLVDVLHTLPHLQTLELNGVPDTTTLSPKGLARLFAHCRALIDVTLWNLQLNDQHVHVVAPVLERSRTLKFLSLRENCITDDGFWRLATMLEVNPSLVSLFHDETVWEDRLQVYLQLNQLGCGNLCGGDIVDALEQTASSPSLSYALLRQHVTSIC